MLTRTVARRPPGLLSAEAPDVGSGKAVRRQPTCMIVQVFNGGGTAMAGAFIFRAEGFESFRFFMFLY